MISAAFIVSSLLSSVSFHGRSMCVGKVAQLIIGGGGRLGDRREPKNSVLHLLGTC